MRLLIALLLCLPSLALADLKSCQTLYAEPPTTLAGLALREGKDLEKRYKGSGYSLQYGSGNATKLSLFFYDNRKRRISRDYAINEFTAVMRGIVEMGAVRQGNVKGRVTATAEDLPTPTAVGAAFLHTGPTEQKLGNDYLFMGVINNCLYKLRFTPPGSATSADRKFKSLMEELARHFDGL